MATSRPWYARAKVVVNKLIFFLPELSKYVDVDVPYTNHSLHATDHTEEGVVGIGKVGGGRETEAGLKLH